LGGGGYGRYSVGGVSTFSGGAAAEGSWLEDDLLGSAVLLVPSEEAGFGSRRMKSSRIENR